MTIEKFSLDNKVKRRTVVMWINNGYIPNADLEKNYIPNSARPPYTKARAKNANAIYVSMVKAAYYKKHIFPALYKICDEEFNGYVEELIRCGLLRKRKTDGVTYYDATARVRPSELNQKFILSIIEAVSRGVTGATLDHISNL